MKEGGCRWEHDVKMDRTAIGWGGMDRITLAQDRDQWLTIVNMVMNLQIP
jgi:hypothetical protein